ncbi:hypothetical protein E2R62_24725 [Citrobacter rodentium]|uniref:Uncharacterized protein n=1 Tax=Citrobacter rodentium TaxID=67825 RepID=A0A482PSP5_CITRO|nr:hypothetical protein E2R62_24725 [Citrobacter rodentium]HAT8012859.1 hypothetical protein [Citrobacter rodentium NBRC 105723 = DSM 16636]HAT8017000.1 hypothetical protein [Citrobacter rodentium]HAT8027849.1 hypothetical protein [Citrobacter rodentium]HAT8031900.1 hypothetical protein [Citrobacter rodentium]
MLRLFSQFPANFALKTAGGEQNSDKTKRPAGRFHIIFSNILEKRQRLQMRFQAMLPAPRHGGEAKIVS